MGGIEIIIPLAIAAFVILTNLIKILRQYENCLLYTSPSPRDLSTSRMPSSA